MRWGVRWEEGVCGEGEGRGEEGGKEGGKGGKERAGLILLSRSLPPGNPQKASTTQYPLITNLINWGW